MRQRSCKSILQAGESPTNAAVGLAMAYLPPGAIPFVRAHRLEVKHCLPIAADASSRRYYRIVCSDRSVILAQSSPQIMEDFITRAELLRSAGFSAPAIEAQLPENGLMIVEDLGQQGFGRLIDHNPNAIESLYELAVDVVIALRRCFAHGLLNLNRPVYSSARMIEQAMLFVDSYLRPRLDPSITETAEREMRLAWSKLEVLADSFPMTVVLRDYHPDNLVYLPERNGLAACGLLDFQDAGLGSPLYDLVSLLEDARREVPAALKARMLARYMAANTDVDPEHMRQVFAIWSAIRHVRVIAVFTQLGRSGRKRYLAHLPRVWQMLSQSLRSPGLEPLAEWFSCYLPDQLG